MGLPPILGSCSFFAILIALFVRNSINADVNNDVHDIYSCSHFMNCLDLPILPCLSIKTADTIQDNDKYEYIEDYGSFWMSFRIGFGDFDIIFNECANDVNHV